MFLVLLRFVFKMMLSQCYLIGLEQIIYLHHFESYESIFDISQILLPRQKWIDLTTKKHTLVYYRVQEHITKLNKMLHLKFMLSKNILIGG